MPVIHGYIDQRNFTESGNRFSFVLISRRSRIFAGTRYLRRGINHEGYVANWVEVEQIVYRHTSSLGDNLPMMSSFVQVRGSIPFFWTQMPNPLQPKPDIIFDKVLNEQAVATRKHFARCFEKYGNPLVCLNLTKAQNNREETIAAEYRNFVRQTLNNELPP